MHVLVVKQLVDELSALRQVVEENIACGEQGMTIAEITDSFKSKYGFAPTIKPSGITHMAAGNGVWVDGTARVGQVVAMFPGASYHPRYQKKIPGYPNIGRSADFLMSRFDGYIVDSRGWKQTKVEEDPLNTAEGGDGSGSIDGCRKHTFVGLEGRNPLACGHMINHPPKYSSPNVIAAAFDFEHITEGLRRYVPIAMYDISEDIVVCASSSVSGIAFVALRDIEDEEIYVNYRLNPSVFGGLPKWYEPVDEHEDQRRWT